MLDYHIIISKIKLKQVAVAESRITFVNKFVNLQRIFIFTFFMLVLLCDLKGCPKGFLQRICNTTCPSGFEEGNCNEKCNCTENQDCNSAIVCLKQNDSIYTLKTPLQYDTESKRATGNITMFSKVKTVTIVLFTQFLLIV